MPTADSLFSRGEAPVSAPEVGGAPITPEDLDPAEVEAAQEACEDAGIEDPLAIETCVYDVAATGDVVYVDSAATLEEAVEELAPSASENVFATEAPDLVPDDEASFPWVIVLGVVAALAVVVGGVAYSMSTKAKRKKAMDDRVAVGTGPTAGGRGPG